MKVITFSDLIQCQTIENPMAQQLFLLSRFFNISESEIGEMGIGEIQPMLEEMNKYFETCDPYFSKKNVSFGSVPVIDEPIDNRSDILDLRKD